jgi:oligopeptidase A
VTRASELGKPELDNTAIIARELRLRREKARLLGYATFAQCSMVPKMADSPEAALAFLDDLAARALPHARRDYAELQEFARTELGLQDLRALAIAFASARRPLGAFSDQEVAAVNPKSSKACSAQMKRSRGPDRSDTAEPGTRT